MPEAGRPAVRADLLLVVAVEPAKFKFFSSSKGQCSNDIGSKYLVTLGYILSKCHLNKRQFEQTLFDQMSSVQMT